MKFDVFHCPLLKFSKIVDVAFRLMLCVLQLSCVVTELLIILVVVAVLSCVTVMLDVDVQPLAPVTVTVLIPGEVMLADADDPKPLFHE